MAVASVERKLAHEAKFSQENFAAYLRFAARSYKLRMAIAFQLDGRPFVMESVGSKIEYLGTNTPQ